MRKQEKDIPVETNPATDTEESREAEMMDELIMNAGRMDENSMASIETASAAKV